MDKEILNAIVSEMDFMDHATNVYRTAKYIIRQHLSIEVIDCIAVVYSNDTFFARTSLRDAQYEFLFASKGKGMEGKRVPSTVTTRTYVD